MVKAARFLDGANSYYVVVDGEQIPALWADDLYLKNGYFDQPGWGNDNWTELFFQKVELGKVIALCKYASPYYKGIEALYAVDEVDTRNGALKFRLVKKIEDLKGILDERHDPHHAARRVGDRSGGALVPRVR